MARDIAHQASALKESAEYQVAATFYVDQAAAYFDLIPQRAVAYYLAAINLLEHAVGLLNGYPLGNPLIPDIQMRIATFRSYAEDLERRKPRFPREEQR
jgi:hypothetical protein